MTPIQSILHDTRIHKILANHAQIFISDAKQSNDCLVISGSGIKADKRSLFMHIAKLDFDQVSISITITDNNNTGASCYMTISSFESLQDAESVILRIALVMIDRILDGCGAPIQILKGNQYVS